MLGCRGRVGYGFVKQLDAGFAAVGDGNLLIGAALTGQRQELRQQGPVSFQMQGGNKQGGDNRQIGQTGAVFQASNLFPAITNGPPQFVLGEAGSFAEIAQRGREGIRQGNHVIHHAWLILPVLVAFGT